MNSTRGPGIGHMIQLSARSKLDDDMFNYGKDGDFSFFKSTYKQHYPFSIHHDESNIMTKRFGKTIMYDVPKKTHLLKSIYLIINIDSIKNSEKNGSHWINGMVFSLIKNIKIRCGNFEVTTIPGEYLYIKNSLSMSTSKKNCFNKMTGCFNTTQSLLDYSKGPNVVMIEIPFINFFPILSIRENNIRVIIETNTIDKLIGVSDDKLDHVNVNLTTSDSNIKLSLVNTLNTESVIQNQSYKYQFWMDFIELCNTEEMLYLYNELKYLYTQINYHSVNVIYNDYVKIELDSFENPTTQLIITVERTDNVSNNKRFMYQPIKTISLWLNNYQLKYKENGKLFRNKTNNKNYTKNIHCIPFSIDTELTEYQPSGYYNFSNTTNNYIELTLDPKYIGLPMIINVYGPCYNQLVINKGDIEISFT